MSYVLDALRRADAERERGSVPTLHSQPEAAMGINPPRHRRPSPVLLGGVAALVLAAGGWLAWTLILPAPSAPIQADAPLAAATEATTQAKESTQPESQPAASRQSQAPVAAPVRADRPVPTPAPAAVAEAPQAPPQPQLAQSPPVNAPPTGPQVAARAERPSARAVPSGTSPTPGTDRAERAAMAEARRERPRPAPSAAPAVQPPTATAAAAAALPTPSAADTAPAAASAAAAPNAPVALAQLPASVRGELPTLTVGGSMYSDEPAARLVILNGQPYRERDTVAPGLTLELIQPRAAILEYRGYRIRLKL